MAIEGKIKTNEDFWINMAAESIYSSNDKVSKSCESLRTSILWAFTIFSVGGFAATVFGSFKDYNNWALGFFGIAFFLFIIAYAWSAKAQYPVLESYYDADPVAVKTAINQATASQAERFKIAATITLIGFFLLASGVLIQFNCIKEKKETISNIIYPGPLVKTSIYKQGNKIYVPVTTQGKKNDTMSLSLINITTKEAPFLTNNDPKDLLFSNVVNADSSGRYYFSYELPNDTIKNVLIKVTLIRQKVADTLIEHTQIIKVGFQ